VRGKINNSKLKEAILEVYSGPLKESSSGFQICCPFHDDNNPSCMIFYSSGIFSCFVCHGDRQKGHRGVSPYKGFQALGMPEAKARKLFLTPSSSLDDDNLIFDRLPSFDSDEPAPVIKQDKVVSREPWPLRWSFRDLDASFMASAWFKKRFEPTKVVLKGERLPRIAFSVGGAEKYKDTSLSNYMHHEVYLRLSSAVKAKAINSHKLSFDLDINYTPASLFGLVNNKLPKDCRGVILVEGSYDGLHLLQYLSKMRMHDKLVVISLLGTPQWSNCLKQIQNSLIPIMTKKQIPFILAFDNDKAGVKLTTTAIRDLQSLYFPSHMIKILAYSLSIKDPGESSFTFELFLGCLNNLGFLDEETKQLVNIE
jgi:hypothetical protein